MDIQSYHRYSKSQELEGKVMKKFKERHTVKNRQVKNKKMNSERCV